MLVCVFLSVACIVIALCETLTGLSRGGLKWHDLDLKVGAETIKWLIDYLKDKKWITNYSDN